MPIACPTCQHTHPNGKRCGSPALRGEFFCFFHHPTRRPPSRAHATQASFYLPPITDADSIQKALCEVMRRLAENSLSPQRASLIFNLIQAAKANLRSMVPISSRYPGLDLSDLSESFPRTSPPPTPNISEF